MRLQVITTQRCNAICDYCDKAVGLAKLSDMELTAQQMQVAVQESIDAGMKITQVTLSGGEPVLNQELQGIIDACEGFPYLQKCRVLTNDMPVGEPLRAKIKHPDDRFRWTRAPLDNPTDPFSGKNKKGVRFRNRVHKPFWVSPDDVGMEANWKQCTIKTHCGRGLDASGWSMCGQAGILGRVLGMNPYDAEKDPLQHINTPIEEICKHCRYGLAVGGGRQIDRDVESGKIPYTISPIFERAFKKEPATYQVSFGAIN